MNSRLIFVALTLLISGRSVADDTFFATINPFLQKHCFRCHAEGDEIHGKVDFTKIKTANDVDANFEIWEKVVKLVSDGAMPPEDEPQPTGDEKGTLTTWYNHRLENIKPHPGFFRPRRLSAHEYRNTLHSLFGFELEVGIREAEQTVSEKSLVMKLLPNDPPGPSGFKNDTSANPLTTVIWDQYSYLVDNGLARLFSPKHREALEVYTGKIDSDHVTVDQAKRMIRELARRAYRRPVEETSLAKSMAAVDDKSGDALHQSLRMELKTILMSPAFVYRGLLMNIPRGKQHAVDDFELAERLSYFLWADMPDDTLMDLAAKGRLNEPTVFRAQIDRMLASPKARNLGEDLGGQWFSLNEIDRLSNNPPVADALKTQPVDYLCYLFMAGRPLVELIDSDATFINPHTAKFYPRDRGQMKPYRKQKGIEVERVPNQKISLKQTTERGGLLTMPGVLAINKGPVLRGTFVLERVLGEHLPEPPPDVGQVQNNKRGENLTFRQRFELHRSKKTCALCHDKIDPLGFALQNYDGGGNFRKNAANDTSGQLPTGETFDDYEGLKQILVTSQREQVVRNIVRRTMSYALCRKLTVYDRPTVEAMVKDLNENNGTFHDLIYQIANSLPFRETVAK